MRGSAADPPSRDPTTPGCGKSHGQKQHLEADHPAGISAYLYTALEAVVLPIGPNPRRVEAIRRPGKSDLLVLQAETTVEESLLRPVAERSSGHGPATS